MAQRVASLLFVSLLLAFTGSTAALAQTVHPLHPFYTNARSQIGDGLPLPIILTPPPYGDIHPIPGAVATIGVTTTVPPSIMIKAGQLTAPGTPPRNVGVAVNNPNVFQVQTSIAVSWPNATATFVANGRIGPDIVTWCPGFPVPTASFNPSCTNPATTMGGTTTGTMTGMLNPPVNSSLRYVRTANALGGTAQQAIAGNGMSIAGGTGRGALVAVRAGALLAPCVIGPNCRVSFDTVVPAPIGAGGGPFGFTNMTPGIPKLFPGVFSVSANTSGVITNIAAGLPANGFTNKATSWGAPWTGGKLKVQALTAAGAPEVFTLTGSDQIVGTMTSTRQRRVSLVTGAVSQRTASKPNANRGWVTLQLPEPGAALGTVSALIALLACHNLVRRRSR